MQFQLNSSTAFRLIPNTNSYSAARYFPDIPYLEISYPRYHTLYSRSRNPEGDSKEFVGRMTREVRIVSIAWTSRAHVAPLRLFHSRGYRIRGFLVARHPFPLSPRSPPHRGSPSILSPPTPSLDAAARRFPLLAPPAASLRRAASSTGGTITAPSCSPLLSNASAFVEFGTRIPVARVACWSLCDTQRGGNARRACIRRSSLSVNCVDASQCRECLPSASSVSKHRDECRVIRKPRYYARRRLQRLWVGRKQRVERIKRHCSISQVSLGVHRGR